MRSSFSDILFQSAVGVFEVDFEFTSVLLVSEDLGDFVGVAPESVQVGVDLGSQVFRNELSNLSSFDGNSVREPFGEVLGVTVSVFTEDFVRSVGVVSVRSVVILVLFFVGDFLPLVVFHVVNIDFSEVLVAIGSFVFP